MLRISNICMPLDYSEAFLRDSIKKKLSLKDEDFLSFTVFRRSIDARDKKDVHFVLSDAIITLASNYVNRF